MSPLRSGDQRAVGVRSGGPVGDASRRARPEPFGRQPLDRQPSGCISWVARWLPIRTCDEVFKALADPSRRLLLDSLNERNGQTLRELCSRLEMARQSVSKHLAVLEAANLVTTVRRGREKHHYLNAAPINEIAERG